MASAVGTAATIATYTTATTTANATNTTNTTTVVLVTVVTKEQTTAVCSFAGHVVREQRTRRFLCDERDTGGIGDPLWRRFPPRVRGVQCVRLLCLVDGVVDEEHVRVVRSGGHRTNGMGRMGRRGKGAVR